MSIRVNEEKQLLEKTPFFSDLAKALSKDSMGPRKQTKYKLNTENTRVLRKDSFPARFGGVHFVNQPWYIHALYTLIKPFLKDKTRKRIFLHGNNLNSLHQLIHPEFLPSEFGGTLPPYDMGTWARTLLGPDYSDENDYTHTSYNAMHVKHTSSNLERECSPKPMKRSQSVVEAGTLKHEEKGENENTQPLLALD
ncbi:Clavesin-1 [Sciurus carolinensis]|uniref:Clavesin-1 n=1 Tax=Sciurus carolinensis TaxID=30640 RepID=A0AA41NB54_SCICA|nr:Clavesin-1 [Sciurus carolinensis]